jgi:arylsulfatase A-like enzyme
LLGAGLLAATLFAAAGARAQSNAASANTNAVPPRPRSPVIVLIVADDLGWGDLGCYGQTKIKTTNLDALAANGMRFTSFYAGSSLSAPSRTALLTGRDTGHAANRGVANFPVPGTEVILPQVFKAAGYVTTAVGKWGLGGATPPGHRGFDDWAGFLSDWDAQEYYPQFVSRTRDGVDKELPGAEIVENRNGQKGRYANDLFAQAALNALKERKPQAYNFFRGLLLYFAPTLPYASPEERKANSAGGVAPDSTLYADKMTWLPAERKRAAMISMLDSYVGLVTNKLRELKYDRNTMVILTSATGPQHDEIDPAFFHSAGPFRGFKHDLYEGGIRVPLIVSWPLQVKPGSTSDLPCAAWDLLPTLAEAAHIEVPKGLDGISLVPTLTGRPQTNQHEILYWELHDHGFKQAVRMGDWKAVRTSAEGPFELYDLKRDPGEKTDVADKNPEVIAKIAGRLKDARTDDHNWPIERKPAPDQ